MFNHSRHAQNVSWTRDIERLTVVYRALRNIEAGEELCISYGDHLTFVDADSGQPDCESSTEIQNAENALEGIQL